MAALAVRLRGVVQGVGFRPYLWRLATELHLKGRVWNDGHGVMLHVYGPRQAIDRLLELIPRQLPPLARLDSLETLPLSGSAAPTGFLIADSQPAGDGAAMSADAATCPECLAEIHDPGDRRYRYPFTNCTHCGPRLSIVQDLPYDRSRTTMAAFPLCAACAAEYADPASRRFHAQAVNCPDCGPRLELMDSQGRTLAGGEAALRQGITLLRQGRIIAVKGLGGFNLVCDAANADTVALLRRRKQRRAKPFALMARDVDCISRYANLSDIESKALRDTSAPIVILSADGAPLPPAIAPGLRQLGFMLPYTGLHSLLLQDFDAPLVFTSANISDEPQCTDNRQAWQELQGVADFWLWHDRGISNRLDDTVARLMAGKIRVLRRGRGLSPEPLQLPAEFKSLPPLLALGADLKNSFCMLQNGQALVSQHIGDLQQPAVQAAYRSSLDWYTRVYRHRPRAIAVDLHPGYLSSRYGHILAERLQIPCLPVQHHHAHLAACLGELGYPMHGPPVLAAIFDGTGLGVDGSLWGGEFLLGDYRQFSRLGFLQPVALPGGEQAIRQPWRCCYAQLTHYFDWAALEQRYADLEIIEHLRRQPLATLDAMRRQGLNSPLSSSCGRWLDAFAAALGLHYRQIDYEGQAAIALEALAAPVFAAQAPYPGAWRIESRDDSLALSWQALWLAVLDDLQADRDKSVIAARLLQTLAAGCVALLLELSRTRGAEQVVLSGGVFQNKLLLESFYRHLTGNGKTVLIPERYPVNDGGIALGQALVIACRF